MGRRPADIFARRSMRLRIIIAMVLAAALLTPGGAFATESGDLVGPHVAPIETNDSAGAALGVEDDPRLDSIALERRPIGPSAPRSDQAGGLESPAVSGPSSVRTIGALGVVIVLIFLTRWVMRKAATRAGGMSSQLGPGGRAPSGVLTVLARYPVGRGQSLVLLQMDQRVLLLNQTTQGFQTLAEITDPEEVASLLVKTRDEESESLATRFTGLLKRFERDPEIVDRNEWPSRNPTTVDAAMRLFPDATPSRAGDDTDPLAAIRQRVADLEGTLA